MSPEAAREAAAQRFGDTARVREACTSVLLAERAAEERRTLMKVSWLDVKLGLRMFAKYPGLSLVAVGGMAIAIAFGAGYFALVGSFLDAPVPIEGGRPPRHDQEPTTFRARRRHARARSVTLVLASSTSSSGKTESKSMAELSAFRTTSATSSPRTDRCSWSGSPRSPPRASG